MQLISTTAAITVEDVLNGEFPNVWLNPSAPWTDEECFCVLGTKEQYEEFYRTQRETQISKRAIKEIPMGVPLYVYRELREQIEQEYKDWWK